MKKLFSTDTNNIYALIARISLGVVMFPHGAQKLLGWFGGKGFDATMAGMTGHMGLPSFVVLMVILIEFFGALFLIFGFSTRLAALGIIGEFIGVVFMVHIHNGFFMNWTGTQKGEGVEYFILLFGLAIISLIAGGGMASIDGAMTGKTPGNNYNI